MMNKKGTKRALISSVLALILCFSMLVGTTFAWFTDTVTSGVNTIQSGTLDVDIVDENGISLSNETLEFVKHEDAGDEAILWEPGCTYRLEPFYIVNKGNLDIKYQIVINGLTVGSDNELLNAIDFYLSTDENWDKDSDALISAANNVLAEDLQLPANETRDAKSNALYIIGHMREDAGNEYQNKELNGISITVYATQLDSEYDSYDNTYDEDAVYSVTSIEELEEAIEEGGIIELGDDIAVEDTIEITKDTVINLNGYNLDASENATRPFWVPANSEDVDVVINGVDETVDVGAYGFLDVREGCKNVTITVNGGKYVGATDNGSFIKVRDNGENVVIYLNDVTVEDNTTTRGFIFDGTKGTMPNVKSTNTVIHVNGGSYTGYIGFNALGDGSTIKNAEINVKHLGICNSKATITVENCEITVVGGGSASDEAHTPSSAVATSNTGTVNMINCKLNSVAHATCIYPTGGTIDMNGCTIVKGDCFHHVKGAKSGVVFTTITNGSVVTETIQ